MLLVDIRMPEIDGFEVIEHAQRLHPEAAILRAAAFSLSTAGAVSGAIGWVAACEATGASWAAVGRAASGMMPNIPGLDLGALGL